MGDVEGDEPGPRGRERREGREAPGGGAVFAAAFGFFPSPSPPSFPAVVPRPRPGFGEDPWRRPSPHPPRGEPQLQPRQPGGEDAKGPAAGDGRRREGGEVERAEGRDSALAPLSVASRAHEGLRQRRQDVAADAAGAEAPQPPGSLERGGDGAPQLGRTRRRWAFPEVEAAEHGGRGAEEECDLARGEGGGGMGSAGRRRSSSSAVAAASLVVVVAVLVVVALFLVAADVALVAAAAAAPLFGTLPPPPPPPPLPLPSLSPPLLVEGDLLERRERESALPLRRPFREGAARQRAAGAEAEASQVREVRGGDCYPFGRVRGGRAAEVERAHAGQGGAGEQRRGGRGLAAPAVAARDRGGAARRRRREDDILQGVAESSRGDGRVRDVFTGREEPDAEGEDVRREVEERERRPRGGGGRERREGQRGDAESIHRRRQQLQPLFLVLLFCARHGGLCEGSRHAMDTVLVSSRFYEKRTTEEKKKRERR